MKDHPYRYPGTSVYRNNEDIRDPEELEAFERAHSADRLLTLPHNLPITPAGYREIYRTMLQDVYDWAGQDRWVDTGRTGPFCKAAFIIPELDKRFAAINAENSIFDLRGGAQASGERSPPMCQIKLGLSSVPIADAEDLIDYDILYTHANRTGTAHRRRQRSGI